MDNYKTHVNEGPGGFSHLVEKPFITREPDRTRDYIRGSPASCSPISMTGI